jgi:hypothetical protein
MLLADAAQSVGGKLYVLGGGWSITGPDPSPGGLAIKIEVPWDEANKRHKIALELLDGDGRPFLAPTPMGEQPLKIEGNFEVGRPPGIMPGSPLDVAVAFNFPPLPLKPGTRYVWQLSIDGHSDEDWQVAFSTRPAKA